MVSYGLLGYSTEVPTTGIIADAELEVSPGVINWGTLSFGIAENVTVTLVFENTGYVNLKVNLTHTSLPAGLDLYLANDFTLAHGSTVSKDITLMYNGSGAAGSFGCDILVHAEELA
jgi:hypothetical protein